MGVPAGVHTYLLFCTRPALGWCKFGQLPFLMPRKSSSRNKQPLVRMGSRVPRKNSHNGRQAVRSEPSHNADEPLAQLLPFWRNLQLITQYQNSIWKNLLPPWWNAWQDAFRLAPSRLTQSILPWSFSAFQFTNEIQGNPEVEYKILTQVAGYGSQLGTIMDFVELMARRIHPDLTTGQTNPDLYKVLKFYDLLKKIEQAKGEVAQTT